MKTKTFSTVDAYLNAAPQPVQPKLQLIRFHIKAVVPDAQEIISYRLPAYKQNGQVLVYFGAFKDHLGFFPTSSGVAAFKSKLNAYKTSKGTIQLPYDQPLPVKLIRDIVHFRLQEVVGKSSKG